MVGEEERDGDGGDGKRGRVRERMKPTKHERPRGGAREEG